MIQVNIHEAKTHLSKLLNKVKEGDEIVIAKGNIPIAKLVPLKPKKNKRTLGGAEGKIKISDGFDAPLEDFEEYM